MLVDEITLFSVPFDKTHTNIIDFIIHDENGEVINPTDFNYNLIYYNTLFSNYEYKKVYNIGNRSIKLDNLMCTFTIPLQMGAIEKFNYMAVKHNQNPNWYTFFFVEGMMSENDGGLPSTTVTLTYDFWANSFKDFYSNEQINYVTAGHKQRFELINNLLSLKLNCEQSGDGDGVISEISASNYPKVIWLKTIFNTPLHTEDRVYNFISNFEVDTLYFQVRNFSSGEITKYNTRGYVGSVNSYAKNIVAYMPYAVIDERGNLNPFKLSYSQYSELELFPYPGDYFRYSPDITQKIYPDRIYNFVFEQAEYIESMEMTYHTPFNYTITIDYSSEINGVYIIDSELPHGTINSIPFIAKIYPKTTEFDPYDLFNSIKLWKAPSTPIKTDVYNYTDLGYPSHSKLLNIIKSGLPSINTMYDPCNFVPPLYKTYVLINGEEIELKPLNELPSSYSFRVDTSSTEPLLSIYTSNPIQQAERLVSNKTYLKNNGQVSLTTLSIDDYLIRNGSQEKQALRAEKTNAIMGTIYSAMQSGERYTRMAFEGKLVGWAALGHGIAETSTVGREVAQTWISQNQNKRAVEARHEDLLKTPAITSPSSGSGDNYYQDSIRVYSKSCIDQYLIDRVRYNSYLYGSTREEYRDVRYNNRSTFDFIKTDKCVLRGVFNTFVKPLIEAMFDSGTFRQHIIYNTSTNETIFDNSFSRNMYETVNLEKVFKTDPEYITIISD